MTPLRTAHVAVPARSAVRLTRFRSRVAKITRRAGFTWRRRRFASNLVMDVANASCSCLAKRVFPTSVSPKARWCRESSRQNARVRFRMSNRDPRVRMSRQLRRRVPKAIRDAVESNFMCQRFNVYDASPLSYYGDISHHTALSATGLSATCLHPLWCCAVMKLPQETV